ncbi:unnamed protein product, partial [Scytosiphon promiscuus]
MRELESKTVGCAGVRMSLEWQSTCRCPQVRSHFLQARPRAFHGAPSIFCTSITTEASSRNKAESCRERFPSTMRDPQQHRISKYEVKAALGSPKRERERESVQARRRILLRGTSRF